MASADGDVRLVPVSRETSEVLHALQCYLIRVEDALGGPEDPASRLFGEWADACGTVIGAWQTTGRDNHSRKAPTFRYLIFTNEERTRMLQAWPNSDYTRWNLHESQREHPGDTWGPPAVAQFTGSPENVDGCAHRRGLTEREEVPWATPVVDGDGYTLDDPKRQAFEPGGSSLR